LIESSIIIPTYQRAGLLSETLDSLVSQTECDFEVIVVCDGEDPQTRALSSTYSATFRLSWIFLPQNRGQASARNAGAGAAEGHILLFLDDDTSACQQWLAHHRNRRRTIANCERAVILGRRHDLYVRPAASHTERLLREAREVSLIDFHERCIRLDSDFSWFPHCGMNSSVPRAVFLAAGGYGSALALRDSGEDTELGTRLFNLGARFIYEPGAVVYHRNPRNLIDNHPQLANAVGRSDLYRVLNNQQRCVQTQRLASLHRSRHLRRIKERLAWDHPEAIQSAAKICRKLTDATGSRFLWRYWNALETSAEYWRGVKSEGVTTDSLSKLVGSPVPVLMFHSVSAPSNRAERDWYISPKRFTRFMAWLRRKQYRCLTPMEWLAGERPPHHVILTFDDGYDDFYTEAFPVLERVGLGAIVFVVVDQIGKSNYWDRELRLRSRQLLTLQQIRELHRHGVAFASHSLTHPDLTLLSDMDLRREVSDSKARLEDMLGSEVTCFAYPSGRVDARVSAAVAEAGYKNAMSTREGLNFWEDPLWMRRINVSERDSLPGFALKVFTGRSVPQHMVESLAHGAQAGLNVLPDRVSHALRGALSEMYWSVSERSSRLKESRLRRPERVPE